MKWFEPIIIIVAVFLVVFPIASYFYKKKKGTLRCECGHLRSECIGNCSACGFNNKTSVNKKDNVTYIVHVEGMKCGMCESHINDAIRKNFDVVKVKSSRSEKTTIIVAKGLLNAAKIREVIQNEGYIVGSVHLK